MIKKKKVLIVHNQYQISGGEDSVVFNEKKLLEENGHEVFLYLRNNNEIKEMSKLRKLILPFTFIYSIRTKKEINKIIEDQLVDIVHVHNTLNLISPAVYYAALANRVPVIQTIHNFRLLCPGATCYRNGHICEDCIHYGLICSVKHSCYRESKIQTLVCALSTKIHRMTGIYRKINYICLTDFNKNKLMEQKQIKENQIFVKHNFVKEYNEIIPYVNRKNQYVYAGRLDRLKGIDLLFNAWKEMGQKAPELIVCGTGPMKEWCHSYVAKHHLTNIKIMGIVENIDVLKIIGESKALVLPTQWYEGFPMSIVEAYSVGTPVLGSDIGNVGNVIEQGITGWKFKHDSLEELIKAVRSEKDLVANVTAEYRAKYTAERSYKQLEEIYNSVP